MKRCALAPHLVLLGMVAVGCGGSGSDQPKTCTVTPIATMLPFPYGILIDGNSYLVTGGGVVDRVDKSSGMVSQVAQLTMPSGSGMYRYQNAIFALDNPPGKLVKFDSSWGTTQIAMGLSNPVDFDLDNDVFIVTDYDNRKGPPGGPAGGNGRVLRVHLDGTVEMVAGGNGVIGGSGGVSVQPEGYYVNDYDGGRLLLVTRDGKVSVVATGLGTPVALRYHNGAFYSTDSAALSAGGRILRIEKNGNVRVVSASGLGAAAGLVIDGSDMIVADIVGGRLLRVSGCLE